MRDHAPLIEALQAENAALRQRLADLEQTEAALQSSQTNLTALIENTDARIWAVDTQYRLIAGNSFFQKFIQQALGQPIAIGDSVLNDRFPSEVRTEWRGYYDRALHGETFSVEIQTRFATPPRTVEYRFNPIQTPAGQVTGTTVFERDITKHKQLEEALQSFKTVIESSAEAIAMSDPDGKLFYINSAHEKLFGRTLEQARGVNYREYYPAESVDALEQIVAPALERGESWEGELDVFDSAGRRFPIWERASTVRAADGSMLFACGFMHEITERRQMEEALRDSRENFRQFIEQSSESFMLLDEQGTIVEWNRAAEHNLGLKREQVIGRPYWLIHDDIAAVPLQPDQLAARRALVLEAVRTGQSPLFDRPVVSSLVLPTGERRSFEQVIFPIKTAKGFRVGAVVHNITAHQQLEEALRASEAQLRALIEHSPAAIIKFAPDGRILVWNAAAERIYGWTATEVLGQPLPTVPTSKLPERLAFQARVNQGEVVTYTEVQRQRKDGTLIEVGLSVSPLYDASGQIYAQMSISTDITERKRAEAALRDLNTTLEQRVADRTAELQAANVRLTELDHLKDEFLSRISHELRTPLAGILISLELLEMCKPEKRQTYMQRLKQATDRLNSMIEDVLMFSQLNLYTQPAMLTPLDLNNLIEGRATAWRLSSVAHTLAVQLNLIPDLPRARVDGELIAQALTRLVNNAINYTPAGTVTIATAQRHEGDLVWATLSVTDTGPGIAPEDLPHIFERFYRGRAAADYKTPGTGVGLSISREIVERMGGHLTVETQVGVGSTFTIWLPTA